MNFDEQHQSKVQQKCIESSIEPKKKLEESIIENMQKDKQSGELG